jgi:hypothetical protein
MIVSHKHKFVFFRSHKTGSTSLQFALSSICGPTDVITPLDPFDEPMRYGVAHGLPPQNYALKNPWLSKRFESIRRILKLKPRAQGNFWASHMVPGRVMHKLGRVKFEEYRKFVVFRSPFSKVISDYFWLRVRSGNRENVPDWSVEDFKEFLFNDQWVRALTRNERFYRSFESVNGVKFLKYEELPGSLYDLCTELSLPTDWVERFALTRAKSGVRPSNVDFSRVYADDPSLVERVEFLFPQLIRDFGYVHSRR